jgi:serine/threonine protein kinase
MDEEKDAKEDKDGKPDNKKPEEITTPPKGPFRVSADTFQRLKLIGKGDVGKVYLVQHKESGKYFAMKILDKNEMIKRNKVFQRDLK